MLGWLECVLPKPWLIVRDWKWYLNIIRRSSRGRESILFGIFRMLVFKSWVFEKLIGSGWMRLTPAIAQGLGMKYQVILWDSLLISDLVAVFHTRSIKHLVSYGVSK